MCQFEVFREVSKRDSEIWALGQEAQGLMVPPSMEAKNAILEVELYNALAEPDPSVPLEKVLKFKEVRRAEFLAFRCAMDDMQKRISESPFDLKRAKANELVRVEKALLDIHTAMSDSFRARFMRSMKVELSLQTIKDAVLMAAGGAFTAAQLGIPTNSAYALVSAAFVAGGLIKFDLVQKSTMAHLPESTRAFAYLYQAARTQIVGFAPRGLDPLR